MFWLYARQGYADYQGGDVFTNFGLRGNALSGTPYSGQFYFYKRLMDIGHIPSFEYSVDQMQGGFSSRVDEGIIGWPINIRFSYLSREGENILVDWMNLRISGLILMK